MNFRPLAEKPTAALLDLAANLDDVAIDADLAQRSALLVFSARFGANLALMVASPLVMLSVILDGPEARQQMRSDFVQFRTSARATISKILVRQ